MKKPTPTLALVLGGALAGGLLAGCDAVFASYLTYDPPCRADDPDLVLCLPFDGNLADGSKNGFTAVEPAPSVAFTPGRVGQAVELNRDVLLRMSDGPAWAVPGFTFATWVRPDELPTDAMNRFGLLDRSGRFGIFLYPVPEAPGELMLTCALNSDRGLGPRIPLRTWSHIACSTDRVTTSFYLNGELVKREPLSSSPGQEVQALTHVGSSEPEGEARLVGALDELLLCSSVRTDEQVRHAYLRGAAR